MMMMISMVTMNMRRMVCNLQQQAWPCSIFGVPSRQVRVLSTLNSFVQLWNHRNIYRSIYQLEHLSQIPVLQGLPLWNLSLIFILNHLRLCLISMIKPENLLKTQRIGGLQPCTFPGIVVLNPFIDFALNVVSHLKSWDNQCCNASKEFIYVM